VRSCPAAKVAFPNRDTYFGPYAAAGGGVKAGTGLYVGANGAAYVGQYAGGLRAGFGVMALPDGGMYRGGFRADKFEGQVRGCVVVAGATAPRAPWLAPIAWCVAGPAAHACPGHAQLGTELAHAHTHACVRACAGHVPVPRQQPIHRQLARRPQARAR
jgi:hypothetical protein